MQWRLQQRQLVRWSSSFRTHTCGDLREDTHDGQRVTLSGWVDAIRPFGPISFISLRDRHGITQLVLEKSLLDSAGACPYCVFVGLSVHRDRVQCKSTGANL